MTTTPYAKTLMQIDGGASVSGAQLLVGGEEIQLLAESTVGWDNNTWQIYEYPTGYTVPAGWTDNNGIYENSEVIPPTFFFPETSEYWGKIFTRLVVNQGLLEGVYAGPGSVQPLVDISGVLETKSPFLGLTDIGFRETNQFDTTRQWIGQLKETLRRLDTGVGGGSLETPSDVVTRIARFPMADGQVRSIRAVIICESADGTAAVRGEWEVKGGYKRVAGTLSAAYAATVTALHSTGGPGTPTVTLNGNTDVDINITGVAATPVIWKFTEFTI